ncbi:MoxR family ATPase [Leptolyngbya sp. PL-A3]|uniref:AAA family ATPase n=1 Tax=Leptolyngbya sp. PL-A3 TaxID=2933911 RepID=UPI003298BB6E
MSDWKIFRGSTQPHDGIEDLLKLEPPTWRKFGRASAVKEFDLQDPVWNDSDRNEKRGASFRVPENQPELIDIINAALHLRRPLLITGKPGTGKTSLAYAVAYELKLGPVLVWPITARATLQEGLYRYDAISRLQDTKTESSSNPSEPESPIKNPAPNNKAAEDEDISRDIGRYIQLGPVGTALLPSKRPRVLLIDEVDKSDINLPNDLLNLFEEGEYEIPELARIADKTETVNVRTYDKRRATIKSGRVRCYEFPFIVLTSNGERDFPPAFLRRCLRLTIKDPDEKALTEIVEAHLGKDILDKAKPLITKFVDKRSKGDLSPDQLLNAVYLVAGRLNSSEDDKDKLAELLMEHLK